MKAILARPGSSTPIFVADHPQPTPAAGEVLIRVRMAGICSTDLEILKGYMGFAGVLGHEFVGDVVDGPAHLVGRRLVGEINCVVAAGGAATSAPWVSGPDPDGHQFRKHADPRTVLGIAGRDGAFAEFVALPAENCHVVPEAIDDRAAVFVEPLAAAAQIVRDHPVGPNTRVGVIGSGRLGVLCAQVLALHSRAVSVLGRNPRTLDVCRKLGLHTISFDAREVAQLAAHRARFDLMVECTGAAAGLKAALQLVRPRGTIVLKSTYSPVPTLPAIDLSPAVINELTIAGNRCGPFADALDLLAQGQVAVHPLIEAEYSLEEAEAAFSRAAAAGSLKVLLRLCGA